MALPSLRRTMLAICIVFLAMQCAVAQIVAPTNDTSGTNMTTQFTLDTILQMQAEHYPVVPLTNPAGVSQNLQQLKAIDPKGLFFLTNVSSVADLEAGNIAYISCEPDDYTNSALDAAKTVSMAAAANPDAIILYSRYASQCTFNTTTGFNYNIIYTMIAAADSTQVFQGLLAGNPPKPNTSLNVNEQTYNAAGSDGNDNSGSNVLGKSPTTAVAMIILYSITGIITALFLAIIVVGAVRAHRHPERYGPRRMMGRPRQSRARGIARAMLETLPIVKFGDKEEDKPAEGGRDVELAEANHSNATANNQEAPEHSGEEPAQSEGAHPHDGPDKVETVAAPEATTAAAESSDPASAADNGLACSVCTDDFVKGQDIRVLPCKHKFHPECIDPWLLNVSGTCPLCRVDLHPTTSHGSDAENEEFDEGPSLETREWPDAPEVAPVELTRRNRRSRILSTLNIGRMRHATPEERIAALRRLRTENQASDSTTDQGGRSEGRFSRRISRVLGGSRGGSRRASEVLNSRPVSEVPHTAAELATPTGLSRRPSNLASLTTAEAPPPSAENEASGAAATSPPEAAIPTIDEATAQTVPEEPQTMGAETRTQVSVEPHPSIEETPTSPAESRPVAPQPHRTLLPGLRPQTTPR